MALLPLKQTITVVRTSERNEWGEGGDKETLTFKCRVDENSQVVQNAVGEEVVSGLEITLDKLADIRYGDEIKFTNELGHEIIREPIRIEIVRMANGKPTLTIVYA